MWPVRVGAVRGTELQQQYEATGPGDGAAVLRLDVLPSSVSMTPAGWGS